MTAFYVFFGLAVLCGWESIYRRAMRRPDPPTVWDGAWFGAAVAFFLSLWLHVGLNAVGAQ